MTSKKKAQTKSAAKPVRAKARGKTALPAIAASPKSGSKTALLLELLRQPQGVTVAEAATAMNWQHHSVRGMLAGTVKGKLKLPLEHVDGVKPLRYRLAS
jgi:Protein of unknown function (DUF3489)